MPEPLIIVSATYGAVGSDKDLKDVTKKIRDLVSKDGSGISLIVSPENIKIKDPAPQSQKHLIAKYKFGEKGDVKTDKTLDGVTWAVYVPKLVPTSGAGQTAAMYAMLWKNIVAAAGMFAFVLSIAFAYSLGINGYGSWILFVAIAFMLPYMGVGGLVFVVLLHTAIVGKFVAFEPGVLQQGVSAVKSVFNNARSRVASVLPPRV
jgi:hypothetical protein